MSEVKKKERPIFPERVLVTGGMPYGEKELFFHHVGGVFVHADIFARFMRDRIGKENVLFISGTDCYGAGVELGYDKAVSEGFVGSINDFVAQKHDRQKVALEKYQISLDIYSGSALPEASKIHNNMSAEIFNALYDKGFLKSERTTQFYDSEKGVFLNGRQVKGRCPIQGCKSENAYADECSLGHQYRPDELIDPVSVLSGKTPDRVTVNNWFFELPQFSEALNKLLEKWENDPTIRKSLTDVVGEFLRKPSLYIKNELLVEAQKIDGMPRYTLLKDNMKASSALEFDDLDDRDKAKELLTANKIRYYSGKTVVPFRLSGNVKWGVPVPDKNDISGLTFWVWPESLWAPVSFTKVICGDEWEKWWKSDNSRVYQFIGEDNIYFYAIAEMGIFTALDEGFNLPTIVPNKHILYGKTKASSSGTDKPPKAEELLDYYTPEQLRLHFMNASLSEKSVSFEPKAFKNNSSGYDAVLYEGNLATNIFNRLLRSCFYTVQKCCNGVLPGNKPGENVIERAESVILDFERLMYNCSFDKVFELLNLYLRDANKDWSARSRSENLYEMKQLISDSFHVIRTATTLFHPITPFGCEAIREYLNVDERLWDWKYIFEPLSYFMNKNHSFKFLESRVDFFKKHESQFFD
ncbi:MAG: class I tRNA ligase family protein [Clostridiaceae bacterium]|nr:class I tRNA ligase family protein [Clostridiaceae bacterium]